MKVLLTSSSGATMVLQSYIPSSVYLAHLSSRSISIAVQKLGCNSFTHCANRNRKEVLQKVDRVLGQLIGLVDLSTLFVPENDIDRRLK